MQLNSIQIQGRTEIITRNERIVKPVVIDIRKILGRVLSD